MTLSELLRTPSDDTVERDLQRFGRAVARRYGERLRGVYLFGSRARGTHRPDSDVAVAVVVDGGVMDWRERAALSDLSFDFLVNDAVDIQAWPISAQAWDDPSQHSNPALVSAMKRDAKKVQIP